MAMTATAGVCRAQANAPGHVETDHERMVRWFGRLAPKPDLLPPVPTLPAAGQVWTIEQALARALDANPDVQVALAGVQKQDGVLLESQALLLPRIAVSASADWRDPALTDRSNAELSSAAVGQGLTPISTRGYNSQVELRQPIFDGLASWMQIKRTALLKKKASVDARDAYLRVASQVRQAYDAILVRQLIVGVRRDAARDMAHLSEVAQKRFNAGEISEYESLRAQSATRSADADLAQAEADLARTEELFCRMLYIEKPAGGLQLAGKLEPFNYRETFEAALARAQVERLDVRSAALQLDAAKLSVQVTAASALLPRVDGYVNYGYRSSYYDANRQLEGWSAGVTGTWNIFDSGQTLGSIRTQRADRRVAEIRLAESQRLVGSQVHELFAALDQSKTVMSAQASARDLGERSVSEARKLYEVGRVSLEEVLNTELAYRQALVGWLSAVFTYNTSVYQLDYATANESFLDGVAKKP